MCCVPFFGSLRYCVRCNMTILNVLLLLKRGWLTQVTSVVGTSVYKLCLHKCCALLDQPNTCAFLQPIDNYHCQPRRNSQQQTLALFLSSFQSQQILRNCKYWHFSASRGLTQPLLDCILYLTLIQYPYDPGTLPSSAGQCILGKVYLRSNLSSNPLTTMSSSSS